jgi:hypothetical protein
MGVFMMFESIHDFIGGPKFVELCTLPDRPGHKETLDGFDDRKAPLSINTLTPQCSISEVGTNPASVCQKAGEPHLLTWIGGNSYHCNGCGRFFHLVEGL